MRRGWKYENEVRPVGCVVASIQSRVGRAPRGSMSHHGRCPSELATKNTAYGHSRPTSARGSWRPFSLAVQDGRSWWGCSLAWVRPAAGAPPDYQPIRITLDRVRHEALSDMLLAHLSLVPDIPTLIDRKNFERAEARGRQCLDCLRLLLDGIGLDPGDTEVELVLAPEDAARVFLWLREEMLSLRRSEEHWQGEGEDSHFRTKLVLAICDDVLGSNEGG